MCRFHHRYLQIQPKQREPFVCKQKGQNRPRGVLLPKMADKMAAAEPWNRLFSWPVRLVAHQVDSFLAPATQPLNPSVHHVHASGMDNCTLRSEGRTLSMPRALDNVDNLMVQAVESLSYGCGCTRPLQLGSIEYNSVSQNKTILFENGIFTDLWLIRVEVFVPKVHVYLYVCLFVCLFWIRNRICPTGSTPDGGPAESSPTTQATRHPRASLLFMSPIPPYLCHASCIRSVPSPVLLSYTDILPSIWSAPSLSSCPTHIFNPHKYEPLKPHICNLEFDIRVSYIHVHAVSIHVHETLSLVNAWALPSINKNIFN